MAANSKSPIIVIKRIKKGAHAHHGGNWKVAYADFVTAMMVFFLLLWLLNVVPEETLQGIGNYFTPTVFESAEGMSDELELEMKEKILDEGGIKNEDLQKIIQKRLSGFLKEKFGDTINVLATDDGIIIRVESARNDKLFDDGISKLTDSAKEKLKYVLKLIKGLPYYVSISGHTDSNELSGKVNDKWQVSLNRANSARKFLKQVGMVAESVASIVAKGDFDNIDDGNSIRNRRIEVKLLNKDGVSESKRNLPGQK